MQGTLMCREEQRDMERKKAHKCVRMDGWMGVGTVTSQDVGLPYILKVRAGKKGKI